VCGYPQVSRVVALDLVEKEQRQPLQPCFCIVAQATTVSDRLLLYQLIEPKRQCAAGPGSRLRVCRA
jgi:hypothetical protein